MSQENIVEGIYAMVLISDDKLRNGKIYTMYHGTTLMNAKEIIANGFLPSIKGWLGMGVYLSRDKEKAAVHPVWLKDKNEQVVLKVTVNVGRVIKIDDLNHPLRMTWHANGYDTAWLPQHTIPNVGEIVCVWDPKMIKLIGVVKAPSKQLGRFPVLPDFIWWEEDFRDVHLSSDERPEDDKIYVMYHGTTLASAIKKIKKGFKRSMEGLLGKGIYVTRDINTAAQYPRGDQSSQVILKLRVNVGKVLNIDHRGDPMQKNWYSDYDMAYVPAYSRIVKHGTERDCFCDPKRIKVVGIVDAPRNCLDYLETLVEKYKK
ncbi:uncharacterized protein LOC134570912 [Pelobates fuscus]|uniref:uncharacterized protein LOC134570912 n=1 Tax=Pelobates fuscus TaxID=191477 RepID=UPI002FE47A02